MAAPADQIEVSGVAFVAIGMKTHGNRTPHAQWNRPPICGGAQREPLIHIKRPGPRGENDKLTSRSDELAEPPSCQPTASHCGSAKSSTVLAGHLPSGHQVHEPASA
jgi:hypothetical protein